VTETKRCSGIGRAGEGWGCEEEYPDHILPIDKFSSKNRGSCKVCRKIYDDTYNPYNDAIRREAHKSAGITQMELRSMPAEERKVLIRTARSTLNHTPEKHTKPELPKIQKDPKTKSISVPRETYPREGYVYIFQDRMKPNGVYKIGSTDDVGGRLSNARTWGEFQCVRWFYSDDCKALEKNTHSALSEFKIKKDGMGDEWFQIAKDAAINKIQELSNASTAV
jgi:hypothetical protein